MKARHVITFMLLPLLLDVLIVSCCDCEPPEDFTYSNCTLVTQNLNNSGPAPIVTNEENVPKEAFGLKVVINRKENVCMKNTPMLFSTSAYAVFCECFPETNFNGLDSILSLNIFTINDFDSTHLAGSNVSNYFKAYKGSYINLDKYAQLLQEEFYSLNDTIATGDILLLNVPDNEGPHQFRTEIMLSDGRTLESISPSIRLK